jgi:hypothetical protein
VVLAWALGLLQGAAAGFAAGLLEAAVLSLAGLAAEPVAVLLAWTVAGGACGAVAAVPGAVGPRWASSAAVIALAWSVSPVVGSWFSGAGAPPALGVGLVAVAGVLVAWIVGHADVGAAVHQAAAAFTFALVALLAPIDHHLWSDRASLAWLAVALGVAAVGIGFAGAAALVATSGRALVLPIGAAVLLGGAVLGAVELDPGPEAPGPVASEVAPILMVVVSGLRADRVGFAGHERSHTPNLDDLARRGRVFTEAHATSSWTVPSLATLLTGRLPAGHGAGRHTGSGSTASPLRPDVPTLAEELRRRGVHAEAVVSDPALRRFGLDRGFARWADDPGRGALPTVLAPLRVARLPLSFPSRADADQVRRQALARLAALPERGWFLLVVLGDAGGPLTPSAADVVEAGATTRPWPNDRYEAAVRRVDRAIGDLLLAAPPATRVIVTGDRGLHLGETRGDADARLSGGTMYQELVHVPLLLAGRTWRGGPPGPRPPSSTWPPPC